MKNPFVRWILIVGGSAALLTVALMPRSPEGRLPWYEQQWVGYPAVMEAARASRRATVRENDLNARWRSASARLQAREAAARARTPLSVLAGPGVPAALRERFEQSAREELAAVGVREPKHPIVVSLLSDSLDGSMSPYQRVVVLPRSSEEPCTVILRIRQVNSPRTAVHGEDRLLGTCAFFGAFGTPGAGTREWLLTTRAASASYLVPPPGHAGDTAAIPDAMFRYYAERRDIRGCRAALPESCLAVVAPTRERVAGYTLELEETYFSNPIADRLAAYPDVISYWPGSLSSTLAPITLGLAAGLYRDLGPARFEVLWQSERGLLDEYERREGRPLSAWTHEYLMRRTSPHSPGPGIPPLQVAWALAIIAAATAWAILRTRRVMS